MDSHFNRHLRLIVTCASIAVNALFAGGIFTFPLLSPALASHLKLSQPQLTTIVLAGMIGQYPFAALVGKVIDLYGPWASSLISSVLFSSGFGLFSLEIAKTPDDISQPSSTSFYHLALLFFIAGLGTVFSYFSSLFAASKNFPNYPGIAAAGSMGLFGLSPLFLSLIASNFFTDATTGLDVTHFLQFLAISAGIVHLLGAFVLKTPSSVYENADDTLPTSSNDLEQHSDSDERSPLLANKANVIVQIVPVESEGSAADLLRDSNFWILAIIVLITLGSCEMVISNIGTIVLSLPTSPSISSHGQSIINRVPPADVATATQVRVLSLANTISRLFVGPLADFVSPVASYLPSGIRCFPRKHHVSRVVFLSGSTLLLAVTFVWTEAGVRSQGAVWILSIGTGVAYGITFTVLPSVVSSIWGLSNLGRNFGILTYAPFIGTPLFSYLYAFVAAHQSSNGGVCEGSSCWQFTLRITAACTFFAFCGSLLLWRSWKGRV